MTQHRVLGPGVLACCLVLLSCGSEGPTATSAIGSAPEVTPPFPARAESSELCPGETIYQFTGEPDETRRGAGDVRSAVLQFAAEGGVPAAYAAALNGATFGSGTDDGSGAASSGLSAIEVRPDPAAGASTVYVADADTPVGIFGISQLPAGGYQVAGGWYCHDRYPTQGP